MLRSTLKEKETETEQEKETETGKNNNTDEEKEQRQRRRQRQIKRKMKTSTSSLLESAAKLSGPCSRTGSGKPCFSGYCAAGGRRVRRWSVKNLRVRSPSPFGITFGENGFPDST